MAAAHIARRVADAYGGTATVRKGVVTENCNLLLDVRGFRIADPMAIETEANQLPGVVSVGIVTVHRPRVCLLGTGLGVRRCGLCPTIHRWSDSTAAPPPQPVHFAALHAAQTRQVRPGPQG